MSDSFDDTNQLAITMVADFSCPWCRIGKANLDAAIAQRPDADVQVTYLPFFLDPTLPVEGKDFREHLSAKFPGVPLDAMFDRVSDAGTTAGIEFRWDLVSKSPNTLRAHQLIAIAPREVQGSLASDIYDAYFLEGKDITDLETLADLAAANGLDRAETRERLANGEGAADVLSVARQVSQQGVTGVPFFIFDGRLALSGAQPSGVLLEAMRQASEPVPAPAD